MGSRARRASSVVRVITAWAALASRLVVARAVRLARSARFLSNASAEFAADQKLRLRSLAPWIGMRRDYWCSFAFDCIMGWLLDLVGRLLRS